MRVNAGRPDAAPFEPISPAVNIPNLLATVPNFKPVQRIDARQITQSNLHSLTSLIKEHVIKKGLPLVLENWHLRNDWPKWHFNPEWLKENHGADHIAVRDIPNKSDILMSLGHYLNNLGKLASKFSPSNYETGKQQRLYGKDLDCPEVWRNSLANILPVSTTYLNPKADLMSSLPPDARAENMMCYIGHEGTYTPAHKEMCASLGQNIMVYTSQNGANTEAGSSIWFMTCMADRAHVAEYWTGQLGHDIEVEAHFASLESLKEAPFTVYIVEQRLGDYILVPPLAPHQVWNRGTCTMKAAWNRTTVETLELALHEALPKARLVCRDEQYKNRNIIYDTLKRWTKIIQNGTENDWKSAPPTIKEDYRKLFELFNLVLLDECFSPLLPAEKHVELVPNDYNITCSFCRGNIFNRFLSCKRCAAHSDDGEPYDVCMDCYARGRSCYCVSGLSWMEQYRWPELLKAHADFRSVILGLEIPDIIFDPPKSFQDALPLFYRKTLARVCQEALKSRPYVDPNVAEEPDDPEEFEKKKSKGEILVCHVCCHRHPQWKTALCHNKSCARAYCFGTLWRAFDMDPFIDVLSKFEWVCPLCLKICSCGACRKKGKTKPYKPRGTILGSVTKHVSDPRSVESLVDFGKGNTVWRAEETGGKRKRSDDGDGEPSNDPEDSALKNWDSAVAGPEVDGRNPAVERSDGAVLANPQPEEAQEDKDSTSFDDENRNVAIADEINMFKADSSAAGLEVVQIPIDPALSGDAPSVNTQAVGLSESYARLFENPTTAFAPSNMSHSYLYPTDHSAAFTSKTNGVHDNFHESDMDEDVQDSENPANDKVVDSPHLNYNGNEESMRIMPGATETFWGLDHQNPNAHEGAAPNDAFHQESLSAMLSQTGDLSALEKNPLAFLAAAGLLHSGQQDTAGQQWEGNYFAQGHHVSGHNAMEGYVPENSHGDPAYDQQHNGNEASAVGLEKQGTSQRKVAKRKADKIESDVFSSTLPENRDSAISEWVFKQKKKSKKRKLEGSKIVVLKISPDAWRRYNARIEDEKEEKARKLMRKFGEGDVGTDLTPTGGKKRRIKQQRSPSVEWKKSKSTSLEAVVTPVKEQRRGRPSKKAWIEVDTDDDGSIVSEAESVIAGDDKSKEISKQKKAGRRSLRTGELVEGLDIMAPSRRQKKKEHDSPSAVGKALSPEPSPEVSAGKESQKAFPVSTPSPALENNLSEDIPVPLPEAPEGEGGPDYISQTDANPRASSVKASAEAEEGHSQIGEDAGPSVDVIIPDAPTPDAQEGAKNQLDGATEITTEAAAFDVDGASDSEESESEDEEERRKRLVRMALAEAKSAALLVVQGRSASEAVIDEQSGDDDDFDDENPADGLLDSTPDFSDESEGLSIIPARTSPRQPPKNSATSKQIPFEVVIFRRPAGWAKKAGYIAITSPETSAEPRSPSVIPPVSSLTLRSPTIAMIAIEVGPNAAQDRENLKLQAATSSTKKRGRPGRSIAQEMPPAAETPLPEPAPMPPANKPRGHSRPQQTPQAPFGEKSPVINQAHATPSSTRGRGRGRGGHGQRLSTANTHTPVTDRQSTPPLSKSTPRPRGRPPRNSLNGRASEKQPTELEEPSPRPNIHTTGFTSINSKPSRKSQVESPPIMQQLPPSSQKASRGRGRPSRGRGSRINAVLPARQEPEDDDVFFREMLGGDDFNDDLMPTLRSAKDTTNLTSDNSGKVVVETKKKIQNDDVDDMGWWD